MFAYSAMFTTFVFDFTMLCNFTVTVVARYSYYKFTTL